MTATRVLVVEDERIVALNLKQRLVRLGYEVLAMAPSGAKALAEIERTRPDVILMDINIEGDIDGIETASRIPTEYHTPVIYLTAYSEQATLDRAKATKPYGYLLKPFSERELHATIQMALERRREDVATLESERRLKTSVDHQSSELQAATQDLKNEIGVRTKLEEALAQSQKMEAIGQLTGGIAHDFNNLLQGIDGSITIAKKRLEVGRYDDIGTLLDTAQISTRRAAGLTHRLLAFSRRQPLAPTIVHCGKLIDAMKELLARTIGEKITIEITEPEDLWLTQCDSNQLESTMLNLVINARDAMPEGGSVAIELANCIIGTNDDTGHEGILPGEYVCVAVADSGCGMDAATISQAFEPFFTTKPVGQGTGLGLSMVYGFARQSNGEAKIVSDLGRGTSISLYLPRFSGALEPAGEHSDTETANIPEVDPDKVIVVIDDEPGVLFIVVSHLEDLGYKAIEAKDGTSGLEILERLDHVDLLITDVGLPGLNGRQVADAARMVHPGLKVMFMTGYADKVGAGSAAMKPGMKMITKPFTLDSFAEAVGGMLSV